MLVIILVMIVFVSNGQHDQQDINEQVWKPFTLAIMTQDVNRFSSLHSKDVIRVERNSKKIFGLEEYRRNMEAGWPGWKETLTRNQTRYTFELRFLERICNGEVAYETGYFKNEMVSPSGERRTSYGKFHVTLRKENGTWKILVDSDSNEGGAITEEMFQAAKPLE